MGEKDMKLTHWVLGHLLVGLLIQSHRLLIHLIHILIRLPRTVSFARAICCAHSLTSSPVHGKELWIISTHSGLGPQRVIKEYTDIRFGNQTYCNLLQPNKLKHRIIRNLPQLEFPIHFYKGFSVYGKKVLLASHSWYHCSVICLLAQLLASLLVCLYYPTIAHNLFTCRSSHEKGRKRFLTKQKS